MVMVWYSGQLISFLFLQLVFNQVKHFRQRQATQSSDLRYLVNGEILHFIHQTFESATVYFNIDCYYGSADM
jgi:hypothetical protein